MTSKTNIEEYKEKLLENKQLNLNERYNLRLNKKQF